MENWSKKIKDATLAATAGILSMTANAKEKAGDSMKIDSDHKIERSIGTPAKQEASEGGEQGKLEDKNYKLDTLALPEKNNQNLFLFRLTKNNGEYSSFQEVIEAVKKINPDIRLLTPIETENILNENKDKLSKRAYYVSLGEEVTGSAIDMKAAGGQGKQYNVYTFDKDGKVLASGSNMPTGNDYLFSASLSLNKDLSSNTR